MQRRPMNQVSSNSTLINSGAAAILGNGLNQQLINEARQNYDIGGQRIAHDQYKQGNVVNMVGQNLMN